jgi:hypothetical protein
MGGGGGSFCMSIRALTLSPSISTAHKGRLPVQRLRKLPLLVRITHTPRKWLVSETTTSQKCRQETWTHSCPPPLPHFLSPFCMVFSSEATRTRHDSSASMSSRRSSAASVDNDDGVGGEEVEPHSVPVSMTTDAAISIPLPKTPFARL